MKKLFALTLLIFVAGTYPALGADQSVINTTKSNTKDQVVKPHDATQLDCTVKQGVKLDPKCTPGQSINKSKSNVKNN